jgi:hypothetical protein
MRVGGSDSDACGAIDIGGLALALADAGLRAVGAAGAAAGAATFRVGGAGLGGGALAPAGMPPLSAASPLTASVLILRGSLFGIVPVAAGIGADGDTLEAGGGLAFWFSGGNTTRGPPERELTSTGVSSRDTSFSPPSLDSMRSGFLALASDGAGTTLVGLLSALMIGGSPERGEPTKVR